VPELRGARIVLRPLRDEDVSRLAELGRAPSVAVWWPGIDEPELRRKAAGEDEATAFAIVAGEEPVGLIQYYEEEDPEFRHAGIDLFLGAAWQGLGLGVDAVRTMARYLVTECGHHRLVIDPAADNERAIRAYEKVGFRRVGVMREYWRDADGVWRDGVLLDLLARELAD
jgi:aminoglycoside 6'-N-acetyltransferase